ncbi:hypothetical protein [Actinoplanes sp. OR16]|uniref:hypothetical protein n=1 Tax=Actinoplanes sp. OR16 TaxID=946334 RepID=UPI000FD90460|nr:hypothetical protein [Actinoplanes sp. OR16]
MGRWLISIGAALAVALSGVSLPASAAPAAPAVTADLPDSVDPAACPEVTAGTFGAAPAGPLGGGDCRRIVLEEDGWHLIEAIDEQNDWHGHTVYDEAGAVACTGGYCDLKAGVYTLVAAGITVPFATAVIPFTAAGCEAVDGRGFTGDAYTGTSTVAGQIDCLEVSGGAGAYQVALPESDRATWPDLRLVQPSGPTGCGNKDLVLGASCKVSKNEPVRLIVSMQDAIPAGGLAYRLAAQRMTGETGCLELPAGEFGVTGGETFEFSSARFVTCYTIPAGHAAREILTLAGGAVARVYDSAGASTCQSTNVPAMKFYGCDFAPGAKYTVVVAAYGDGGARVNRLDATGAKCANPVATTFGGRESEGVLRERDQVHCYRNSGLSWINAIPTDRIWWPEDPSGAEPDPAPVPTILHFGKDGKLTSCGSSCQVSASAYFLTSYLPSMYGVGTWSLDGPTDCASHLASVAYGFGPISGTLSGVFPGTAPRAWCQVLPANAGDRYRVTVEGSGGSLPDPYMLSDDGTVERCSQDHSWYVCTPRFAAGKTKGTARLAMVVHRNAAVNQFTVRATCLTGLCGGDEYSLYPAQQINVTAGRKARFTLAGTALHTGDTVRVTRSGQAAIPVKVLSVSAARTSMTVEADFTKAATGRWNVAGTSYSKTGTGQMNNLVNVMPMPKLGVKAKPSVTGKAAVGLTVRATTGTFNPKPASVRYQWTANGVAIKGATGSSYKIPASLRGKRIAVIVTARASGYTDTAVTSAAVTVGYGAAPKATKKPKVTGTVKAGKTVKASVGTWSPAATSYKYEWRINGKVVGKAAKLKLKKSWKGKKLTLTVIAKRTGHLDGRSTTKSVTVKR